MTSRTDTAPARRRWPAAARAGTALAAACALAAAFAACAGGEADEAFSGGPSGGASGAGGAGAGGAAGEAARPRQAVRVLLDGAPASGAKVLQGGSLERWKTGDDGRAEIEIDPSVPGETYVMASHPEARSNGRAWVEGMGEMTIKLTRYSTVDNEAYVFGDPGEPGRRSNTSECGHCHETLNDDWFGSPHRKAASNPAVHDVYAGASAARSTEAACAEAGGVLRTGITPGKGDPAPRCYVGDGVLPALNPGCDAGGEACDGKAKAFGGCADCHAPGIDGKLGGRDLLEARGIAFDAGVHCDVCHHIESIDLMAPPGVGGRLKMLRPSEKSPTPTLGEFWPLTFGPYDDVVMPKMGGVEREHFHQATLCAGCHQDEQPALVPGQALDPARWPSGTLPVHTTYGEWLAGPMNPSAPCQSCHMPPAPEVSNAENLETLVGLPDSSSGWPRPPGAVRHHSWVGPRTPESGMLQLAASLSLSTKREGETLVVEATVKNVGPGHAIPTGEPMRSLVLLVEARCGEAALEPTGGDAVPDFGGYLERRTKAEGFLAWKAPQVGQVIRVVRRPGGFRDYQGFGPFGDGRFSAEEKGMPVEEVAGSATITAVDAGKVTLDRPLPEGDVAYLGEAGALPSGNDPSIARAGSPGFAFARVLASADGRRMVPHFLAVDVASDNRLLPQKAWASTHRFKATCAEPEARAVLVHRAYPIDLARERGWQLTESLMAEARR